MNDVKKQKKIEKKNKEIEDAVLMSQMMDHDGFKLLKKKIGSMERSFRFQDILGIKDDSLKDQKGIVVGIMQMQRYFEDIKKLAEQPRRDPNTGVPEKMKSNK